MKSDFFLVVDEMIKMYLKLAIQADEEDDTARYDEIMRRLDILEKKRLEVLSK